MSLEFIDGFDHYNTAANLLRKWDAASSASGMAWVTGRFGGSAVQLGNPGVYVTLTSVATRVCGAAFKFLTSIPASTIIAFRDSGNVQVDLRTATNGSLILTRNGTTLGTSSIGILIPNAWCYIELKATINSSGSASVNFNGTPVISFTGNTQATVNPNSNQVLLTSDFGVNNINADDLYILNSSGTINNDLLGDCRVLTNLPTGDSAANHNWTPSTGTSHFATVDETTPNDDTDFNSSATIGQIDTLTFPALSASGIIAGVQTTLCARKDDIGPRYVCEVCRSGGSNHLGFGTFILTTAYSMYREIRESDPGSGSPWLLAGVNAAEFGYELIA